MKYVFLCGGYGTRLQRDLQSSQSELKQQLGHLPKGLVPLNKKPLLSHWIDLFQLKVEDVYIITNELYYLQYMDWMKETAQIQGSCINLSEHIYNNGTRRNEDRLGAIKDLNLGLSALNVSSDIIVIAGDTLFLKDFQLSRFTQLATQLGQNGCLVTVLRLENDQGTLKNGILELQDQQSIQSKAYLSMYNKVVQFLEKPGPHATQSRLACPCFYYFPAKSLSLIHTFLKEKEAYAQSHQTSFLDSVDATGKYIQWLVETQHFPVFATLVSGRLDIGGLESYLQANDYISQ